MDFTTFNLLLIITKYIKILKLSLIKKESQPFAITALNLIYKLNNGYFGTPSFAIILAGLDLEEKRPFHL